MTEEHPFAQYVRIIGRGPNLSRPLTEDEMYAAAGMIMRGEVEDLQLGAFLCILRLRTEVPEEGLGFVRAVRDTLELPANPPTVDLDWPTYSGKKRQLPWFLLSALILAQNGVKICMQGTEGHTEGRLYTSEVLTFLGLPMAGSLAEAADMIRATNFAYLPLRVLSPKLQDIIELKSIIGVRSPVNTFARMINPFSAAYEIHTVFHPNYRDVHLETSQLLGQGHMAVFKGEGGEAERRPNKPVLVQSLRDGEKVDEEWPPMVEDSQTEKDETLDLDRFKAVWDGEVEDEYATNAVVGTMAIALRLMQRADSIDEAQSAALKMWRDRARGLPGLAA
ncbi:MAG: glycosyl transferase family protein [Rhodospirillales bacterium]|nr:glycosyl transferase family protein [Rhodospirillales bacterium]